MFEDAETADLVIVLGTSLGGLNADQVANSAAWRSQSGSALGTVCINLQQTPEDGTMSLRLFGRSDDLLRSLLRELGLNSTAAKAPKWPKLDRVLVPYDADGRRIRDGPKMWLDLNAGQNVRITPGHNIQGAKQPMYMHIGATESDACQHNAPNNPAIKGRRPGPGLGKVIRRDEESAGFQLEIEGATMWLGLWWLESAMRGGVDVLPIVNQNPTFEDSVSDEKQVRVCAAGDRAPVGKALARPLGARQMKARVGVVAKK